MPQWISQNDRYVQSDRDSSHAMKSFQNTELRYKDILIQNTASESRVAESSMLLVVHEPDSTSNVNVLQRLFTNTFSGSRE